MTRVNYYHTKIANLENHEVNDKAFHVNIAGIEKQLTEFHTINMRDDYYYLYLIEGKLTMQDNTIMPGDFIIFEPKYEYDYKSSEPTKYLWMHFSGSECKTFLKENDIHTMTARNIGINRNIMEKFNELLREFVLNDNKSEEMAVNIAKEILLLSERYVFKKELKRIPLRSIEYINKNYHNEISVDYLASLEEMKLTKYRTLFKLHTGVSPIEYIIALRLNRAKQLIEQSNLTIEQIASQIGYNDQYYFGRIFKKKTGVSPGMYRRMSMNR